MTPADNPRYIAHQPGQAAWRKCVRPPTRSPGSLSPRPRRLPASFGSGVEPDGQSESGRTSPVSYMSSSDMGPKSLKFMTHHSLLITRESPLSHPPGYSVRNCVNPPASNQAGHSARNSVRNPASYLSGYPASNRAGNSPRSPADCSDGCGDRCSSGRSGNRPDSRRERNPKSCRESNGKDNSPDNSESNWADSSSGCRAGSTGSSGNHVEGCPRRRGQP